MKKKSTSNNDNLTLAVVGASIAGLATTAYFFLGPKGKTHQRHTKAWAVKMKADVIEKLERAREISEPIYDDIINSVASKYEKSKNVDYKEIEEIARDLKKHWQVISKKAKVAQKTATKRVRIPTKK